MTNAAAPWPSGGTPHPALRWATATPLGKDRGFRQPAQHKLDALDRLHVRGFNVPCIDRPLTLNLGDDTPRAALLLAALGILCRQGARHLWSQQARSSRAPSHQDIGECVGDRSAQVTSGRPAGGNGGRVGRSFRSCASVGSSQCGGFGLDRENRWSSNCSLVDGTPEHPLVTFYPELRHLREGVSNQGNTL